MVKPSNIYLLTCNGVDTEDTRWTRSPRPIPDKATLDETCKKGKLEGGETKKQQNKNERVWQLQQVIACRINRPGPAIGLRYLVVLQSAVTLRHNSSGLLSTSNISFRWERLLLTYLQAMLTYSYLEACRNMSCHVLTCL